MLRSIRYGEADRVLHLYTRIAAGLARLLGRAAGQVAAGGPARAADAVAAGAARGPWRALHGQPGRHGARPCGPRSAGPRWNGPSRPATPCSGSWTRARPTCPPTTCSAASSPSSTRTRARPHAPRLAFRAKLLLAAGFAPSWRGCAACGESEHLGAFSPSAGGVVCAACEAGSFPLGEEAHAFLVGALGRLAEAPEASEPAAPGGPRAGRDPRAPRT